jgi:deoxyribose-phosphate aldolase
LVKVIIETALLNDEEKIVASFWLKEAGADFVKTSTGFSSGGATVHDVALMRKLLDRIWASKQQAASIHMKKQNSWLQPAPPAWCQCGHQDHPGG